MIKKTEVNINCPACGTTVVTAFKGKSVNGVLQHKCGKCGRYWNVDYTNKTIIWAKGKGDSTPIKGFQLDLSTGSSLPIRV